MHNLCIYITLILLVYIIVSGGMLSSTRTISNVRVQHIVGPTGADPNVYFTSYSYTKTIKYIY